MSTSLPELDYGALTERSGSAFARAGRRLPGGLSRQTLAYRPHPFFARRGNGAYLEDLDGRRYLDLVNNYTSLIHGHAHEPTTRALLDALACGTAPGTPTELELELANELAGRVASLERLRFAVTGSEAVAFALRAARAFTGRPRILKFEGGFHGCFDEVHQSITAPPLTPGAVGTAVAEGEGLAPVGTLVAVYNDVASVQTAFDRHGDEIAAVIVEPFLGNGALLAAAPGFLETVRRIAHAHGALLVLDEIQSCRLDVGGAQALHGVRPDLTTLGKTIGGGMPLAAFGGRADVMAAFDGPLPAVRQTGTFNAFPASLATGLATLACWRAPDVARLDELGARLRAGMAAVFAAHDVPAQIGGQGSMFHVALADGPVAAYRDVVERPDREAWTYLHGQLLARGYYVTPRGTGCLSTPMTAADLDGFVSALDECVGLLAARSAA